MKSKKNQLFRLDDLSQPRPEENRKYLFIKKINFVLLRKTAILIIMRLSLYKQGKHSDLIQNNMSYDFLTA